MKRSIPIIVATLAMSALTPAANAQAVQSCYVNGSGTVRVVWQGGKVNYYGGVSQIPGKRVRLVAKKWPRSRKVVQCSSTTETITIRLKNGSKWRFTQEPPTQVTVVPQSTVPSPAHPAKIGTWDVPMVLSVDPSVEDNWRVADMAAAWDYGITVTTEPCAADSVGCVPVTQADTSQWFTYAWGAAWPVGNEGKMISCRIVLDPKAPAFSRPEIAAHEIGHCIGLPHWTTDNPDPVTVMSERLRASTPTTYDIAWAKER